jgi:hypothetical protein
MREAIREGHETANYGSRIGVVFRVPTLHRRALNPRARHGFLARRRCEGSGEQASWNGERLRESHCAVDPKKIPYGSKVVLPDATCVAVDSGPDVVNRKAVRAECG